jgi:hypothetical protein
VDRVFRFRGKTLQGASGRSIDEARLKLLLLDAEVVVMASRPACDTFFGRVTREESKNDNDS